MPRGPRLVEVAVGTDRGLVRHENQDVVVLYGWVGIGTRMEDHPREVALVRPIITGVVDGMGGHVGGALAAWILEPHLDECGESHDA